MKRPASRSFSGFSKASGFSLIEVMIAILVLGVGLLGFAMLQTMNVRFSQSANYRTQATNLAYELLDQMRVNRVLASAYLGNYEAINTGEACEVAIGEDLTAGQYRDAWECRLGKTLGGAATASVQQDGNDFTVSISWDDERWVEGADSRTFTTTTQL